MTGFKINLGTRKPSRLGDRISGDFEGRSCVAIKKRGGWIYSKHPSTQVMCFGFHLPGDRDVSLWHSGYPDVYDVWQPAGMWPGSISDLDALFDAIKRGVKIEFHNRFFDANMWRHKFQPAPPVDAIGDLDYTRGVGAPPLPLEQTLCSAAKAAAFALPRSLGKACEALLGIELKDAEGHSTMLKVCSPRKARKNETPGWPYYRASFDLYRDTFLYCMQDIRSMIGLSENIPDLTPAEQNIWYADQRANERGVRIDRELVEAALFLDQIAKDEMNREIYQYTGVQSGTQRSKILAWLQANGLNISNTQAATIEWATAQPFFTDLPEHVKRVTHLVSAVNKTSTAKYQSMLAQMDPDDDCVRDILMYHGASTGRWSGKGVQPQNMPVGNLGALGMTMREACDLVKTRDYHACQAKSPNVLELLSSCARGAFIPHEGYKFCTADYSAVEARFVLWLAGEEEALQLYRDGVDLYCWLASLIFGREITRKNKKERAFGKAAILGLGFGVGALTFLLTLRKNKIKVTQAEVIEMLGEKYADYHAKAVRTCFPKEEDFCRWNRETTEEQKTKDLQRFRMAKMQAKMIAKRVTEINEQVTTIIPELAMALYIVDLYRTRFPGVPKYWENMEQAAISAVKSPGTSFSNNYVTWVCSEDGKFLYCHLPASRPLVYNSPGLELIRTPWGEIKEQVTFYAVDSDTKQWVKNHGYGSYWVENITQACARDQMCYAIGKIDSMDFPFFDAAEVDEDEMFYVMSVHDEIVTEIPEDSELTHQSFERLVSQTPEYFYGCPVAAEGEIMTEYHK